MTVSTKIGVLPTKFRRSFDEVSTKLGVLHTKFRQSFDEVRSPFYEVSTKIGVPKGQNRLPVDATQHTQTAEWSHILISDFWTISLIINPSTRCWSVLLTTNTQQTKQNQHTHKHTQTSINNKYTSAF